MREIIQPSAEIETWLRANAGAKHLSPVYTTKTNPGATYLIKILCGVNTTNPG